MILAEGDYVIIHGRFSNIGPPVHWIAADIVRLKDGILVEHWDVIQDDQAAVPEGESNVRRLVPGLTTGRTVQVAEIPEGWE